MESKVNINWSGCHDRTGIHHLFAQIRLGRYFRDQMELDNQDEVVELQESFDTDVPAPKRFKKGHPDMANMTEEDLDENLALEEELVQPQLLPEIKYECKQTFIIPSK